MSGLNEHYLWASLVWSSVGTGYVVYGKKQTSLPAWLAGLGMIAVSWLIFSALVMSVVCLGLMIACYFWIKASD